MTNITITTEQVFRTLIDMIWDMSGEGEETESQVKIMTELLPFFYNGNIDGIRMSFKEGFAFLMIPQFCELLDQTDVKLEIRVHHRGKLIGVIIDSEINY